MPDRDPLTDPRPWDVVRMPLATVEVRRRTGAIVTYWLTYGKGVRVEQACHLAHWQTWCQESGAEVVDGQN